MTKKDFCAKLKSIGKEVKGGFVFSYDGDPIGTQSWDMENGRFRSTVRTNTQASIIPWRFDESTINLMPKGYFDPKSYIKVGNGRKAFLMVPVPAEDHFTKQPVVMFVDYDRLMKIFGNRSDKWFDNLYNIYIKWGIFK